MAVTVPRYEKATTHICGAVYLGGERSDKDAYSDSVITTRSADFDRLVALYEQVLDLRDRATSEGLVGDSAFREGRELEAAQHYRYADDYRDRARDVEASAERLLREMTSGVRRLWRGRVRARARATARTRRYGDDHLDTPAYID